MKKINVKRFAVILISGIVLAIILIKLATFLTGMIAGIKIVDTEKTITPSVVSEHDFDEYNGQIAVVNSKGVEFYDNKGNYDSDIAFKIYSPYIHTRESYAAVADIGSQNALVLKGLRQAYRITEQEPISSVSVNKNGYTAVITNESGYKSSVVIYDNFGSEVYTWYSGELYVVDVKISDNNKRFAIVGIDSEDSLKSVVKLFKISEAEPYSQVIFESELAYQLEYRGNSLIVLTDKEIRLVSASGKVKNSYEFDGQTLLCFDIKNSKMPVLTLDNKENAGSKVVVLNSSLKEKAVCDIEGQAKMMDENNKEIVVSNGDKLFLISSFGSLKAQGQMHKEAENIKLSDDKKHIFTLSGSTLGVYEIKYGRE